ncbi:MAG TPA: aldehyde dehydrogenase (NADP(+)) [Pyrinomonadaceae bacterium]|nr:aldehyde dehydrogenase (NADP(+)) [Pyrinomonadaceae bacterium]
MNLKGLNFLGKNRFGTGVETFRAVNPASGEMMLPEYFTAASAEIAECVELAHEAFQIYRNKSGEEKAVLLETIAAEILELGDELLVRCSEETGLPNARLIGERGRTVNQLKLFAELLREGSWVDARIDQAMPERQPLPKPDVRSMEKPIGAVAVFGASNFPLAFSVAGGDTVSALAAGCTVVFKAHPAHPGTCEMIASAIQKACAKCEMPDGIFSMVQGASVEVGMTLVKHPLIKAVGFTGSFKGGKAIFDAAVRRDEPIPVYAEMGSVNPVFILPEALRQRNEQIAVGLTNSVTLGVGQFCTNPGVFILQNSADSEIFEQKLAENIQKTTGGVMLTAGIKQAYENGVEILLAQPEVELVAKSENSSGQNFSPANFLKTNSADFLANKDLEEEIFGPSTLAVGADNKDEILEIARNLKGHLTASIFADGNDFVEYRELFDILEQKVGRLIINEFPTGVEVCHAMVHGGPFPATTDRRTTSVGTRAITRFTSPVCYQNFPDSLLPDELKNANPLSIWRIVDGNRER